KSNLKSYLSNVGSRSHVVCKNVLRLAGELSIVRVLNDFQLLSILRIFCMRGFLPPPTDPPWLYASVSGLLCARSSHC
ncbi:hypothetical protein, partial [Salmonella enterica]|uniref:hypothetical protein n=3 Tax=Enterobacteriaceae TaxID=543 RepID=UPI001A9200E0